MATGSVTSSKIATGSVSAAKLATGSVGAAKLDTATRSSIVPPWGTIPKGRLVTGTFGSEGPSDGSQVIQVLTLPAKAPVVLTAANLAFGTDVSIPGDPRCAGDSTAPNPASGVFCVYFYNRKGLSKPYLQPYDILGGTRSVFMYADPSVAVGSDVMWWGVFAYQAP